MAAGKDINTPRREGDAYGAPVKGLTRIFSGTLVAVTVAGLAVPAGHADAVAVVGVAKHHADNRDGHDGEGDITIEKGRSFSFAFDVAPAYKDIGKPVYAIDDLTVSLSNGGARLQAGTLDGIDRDGPWVRV